MTATVVAEIVSGAMPLDTVMRHAQARGLVLNVPRTGRGPCVLYRRHLAGHEPLRPGRAIARDEQIVAAYPGSCIEGRVPLDEALANPIWRTYLEIRAGVSPARTGPEAA